jgi:Ser-tRNA(Ala) deacylase AlaX
MRVHSAGHLIDFAIYLLGYSPKQLSPLKGDHGKKAYIIYQGVVDHDIKQEIQDKVTELVAQNLKLSCQLMSYEDLEKEAIYLQPNLPIYKPLRALRLENVGTVADGGTQIASTSEAGKISVDSITIENGTSVIKYSLI